MGRKKNILITGHPGVGKTTLIKKLAEALGDLHPSGFYTSEIREAGIRKGFEIIALAGSRGILSHVDIKSPHRVSRYGVDVAGFDRFLDSLSLADPAAPIVVIDEIGKMECFSGKFRSLIQDILNSDTLLVATVAMKGSGLIAEIKKRDDSVLYPLTPENRDSIVPEIVKYVRDACGQQSNAACAPDPD
jgi:nucleoside-triphosphatase